MPHEIRRSCSSTSESRLKELLENGPKTASKSRKTKCFCGTRQSRNHASLSPCVSGTPGESGWPGRINGGSTANLSGGANQDSFSPDPAALPWTEQPCITLCGDSTWQESAAASGPSLRKRSEPLSSVGILFLAIPDDHQEHGLVFL